VDSSGASERRPPARHVGGIAAHRAVPEAGAPMSIHDLPAVNASLNGLSAVFLTAGFVFIKRGNKIAHRNCMIAALCTSSVFLACYLTYHFTVKTITHFVNPLEFRPIYLTILISHTFLATVILPMIIVTVAFRFEKIVSLRKRLALSIILLAGVCFLIGVVISFIFGAPRSMSPHLNVADVISGACFALAVFLGFLSLLLFLFGSHKSIARWTWPLWMYVSVTGVVVYLLLYQIFPQK
jgi:putative membrane protein